MGTKPYLVASDVFDTERFRSDVHAYRRRHGHTVTQIHAFLGINIATKTVFQALEKRPDISMALAVLLANYADLSLDSYILQEACYERRTDVA